MLEPCLLQPCFHVACRYMSRGDLNIVHERPRLRTRRTVHEQRSRSVLEHEAVANRSQTSAFC